MSPVFSPVVPRHHQNFLSLCPKSNILSILSPYISPALPSSQPIKNSKPNISLLLSLRSMAEFSSKKRVRDDSGELFDSGFDSPEVKRLREDLLENFDDGEFYTASHELDSFMKSFEEEILSGSPADTAAAAAEAVVDLASGTGESQPDLGYLLGASDDELGLPPSTSEGRNVDEVEEKTELVRGESDSAELSGGLWGYGEELPSYDSFDVGIGEFGDFNNGGGEYVALDGLFDYDYSDLGFGSGDLTWRSETLPAK